MVAKPSLAGLRLAGRREELWPPPGHDESLYGEDEVARGSRGVQVTGYNVKGRKGGGGGGDTLFFIICCKFALIFQNDESVEFWRG